jgi:bifunctional DNA-binding transcriptional regulator/antitoxin component of YhaV-PrlF toxin-antitoxin module
MIPPGVEGFVRFTKRVVAQGHVTVPQDLRAAMAIDGGDLVEFEVVGVIRKASPASPSRSVPASSQVPA